MKFKKQYNFISGIVGSWSEVKRVGHRRSVTISRGDYYLNEYLLINNSYKGVNACHAGSYFAIYEK